MGLALANVPQLGIPIGWLVFVVAMINGLFGSKNTTFMSMTMAYLATSEVLWRMLDLSPWIPHEGGKYALIVLAAIGIMRRYRTIQDWPALPFLMLLSLLPSLAMLLGRDLSFLREEVIGSLAGPVALALCAIYFNGLRFPKPALTRLALVLIAPIVSIATIMVLNLLQTSAAGTLYFGRSSSSLAAAGFGPNQVSNTVALGALFCWLLLHHLGNRRLAWVMSGILFVSFAGLGIITFSRGGVYTLVISIVGTLFIVPDERKSSQLVRNILLFALFAFAFLTVLWPQIDELTAGAAAVRYADTDTSVRLGIMRVEIELWLDHPLLGVGPGMSRDAIRASGFGASSHTEFTRLLAEHGIFGVINLILLIAGFLHTYRRAASWRARMCVVACLLYVVGYMVQAATRTAAPAFIFGLTWASLFWEADST
ncbi:MAG: O-antigen ligase family protein [Anaerolineae bacterium]|nr:O-antigen ligase family protein [Anaerolineae bacterium]